LYFPKKTGKDRSKTWVSNQEINFGFGGYSCFIFKSGIKINKPFAKEGSTAIGIGTTSFFLEILKEIIIDQIIKIALFIPKIYLFQNNILNSQTSNR